MSVSYIHKLIPGKGDFTCEKCGKTFPTVMTAYKVPCALPEKDFKDWFSEWEEKHGR